MVRNRAKWRRALAFMLSLILIFSNLTVVSAAETTESDLAVQVLDSHDETIMTVSGNTASEETAISLEADDSQQTNDTSVDQQAEDAAEEQQSDDASTDQQSNDMSEEQQSDETSDAQQSEDAEDLEEITATESSAVTGEPAADLETNPEETESKNLTPETNESEEPEDEAYVAPGVWSDADPYFTDEVPAISSSARRRAPARAAVTYPTYDEVYAAITSLQGAYPEGLTWNNFEPYGTKATDPAKYDGYLFRGGAVKGAQRGVGCAGWVFFCSDTGFGDLPAYVTDGVDYDNLKVGDILRVNNSHFVIILRVTPNAVIVSEGNFSGMIHWGRAISRETVIATTNFVVSRYPAGYSEEGNPEEEIASGTEGTLTWSLNSRGVLSISGNGAMPNYTTDNRPSWETYANKIYAIEIADGVTNVGSYAFYQERQVISVYLPDSITSIGDSAFQETSLTSVTIPKNTVTVNNNAFRSCSSLTSVTVSEGVKTIGDNTFRACTSLEYIDFPTTIEKIGAGAFTSSKVASVRFKPGTADVDIGDSAFAQCQNLMSVTLPAKLTKISNFMFQSCTLLSYIYIPASVKDIGQNPFTSCYLQKGGLIEYGGSKTDWTNAGGVFIMNAMPQTQIKYNVPFTDPFAIDPDDPGDIKFTEEENPCANGHTGEADENGNCSVCGQPIDTETKPDPTDPDPTNPDIPEEHQHSWSATWVTDSAFHWHECVDTTTACTITVVSEKDGYGQHEYTDWIVDVAATATQEGSQHRDCTICGYRETAALPATGETSGGDDNNNSENNGNGEGGNTGNNTGNTDGDNTGNPGSSSGNGNSGTNSGNSSGSDNSGNSNNSGSGSNTGGSGSSNSGSNTGGSSNSGTSGGTSGNGGSNSSNNSGNGNGNGGGSGTGTNSGNPGSTGTTDTSGDSDPTTAPANPGTTTSPNTGEPSDPGATDPTDPSDTDNNGSEETQKPGNTSSATSVKKTISKLKKQLKKELTPKLKKQLLQKLKKQIKAKKGKMPKTKLKALLKKQLKVKLKKSLKAPLKKSMKKQFGKSLGKNFTTQFNKAYNEVYAKQYKTQFNKLFKKAYK